ANGGSASGPGRTTTWYPWARYPSATWFSRCSMFMASLWQWEGVYRVLETDVHELIPCLERDHAAPDRAAGGPVSGPDRQRSRTRGLQDPAPALGHAAPGG